MRGFLTDNVSDYSKEQCEQYLKDHPNGLSADYVRERLKVLASSKPKDGVVDDEEEYWKHNQHTIAGLKRYKTLYPQGKHLAQCNALLKSMDKSASSPSKTHPSITKVDSVSDSSGTKPSDSNAYALVGKVVLTVLILGIFFIVVILIKENISSSGWKTVLYGGGATIVSPLLKKIWDK